MPNGREDDDSARSTWWRHLLSQLNPAIDPNAIAQVTALGFSPEVAKNAVLRTRGDVAAAIDLALHETHTQRGSPLPDCPICARQRAVHSSLSVQRSRRRRRTTDDDDEDDPYQREERHMPKRQRSDPYPLTPVTAAEAEAAAATIVAASAVSTRPSSSGITSAAPSSSNASVPSTTFNTPIITTPVIPMSLVMGGWGGAAGGPQWGGHDFTGAGPSAGFGGFGGFGGDYGSTATGIQHEAPAIVGTSPMPMPSHDSNTAPGASGAMTDSGPSGSAGPLHDDLFHPNNNA